MELESAAPTSRSVAGWNTAPPGRTISRMPMKPPIAESQRARVGRSPSTAPEKTMANMGARNAMADASASGR